MSIAGNFMNELQIHGIDNVGCVQLGRFYDFMRAYDECIDSVWLAHYGSDEEVEKDLYNLHETLGTLVNDLEYASDNNSYIGTVDLFTKSLQNAFSMCDVNSIKFMVLQDVAVKFVDTFGIRF